MDYQANQQLDCLQARDSFIKSPVSSPVMSPPEPSPATTTAEPSPAAEPLAAGGTRLAILLKLLIRRAVHRLPASAF